eukprot:Em0003g1661a
MGHVEKTLRTMAGDKVLLWRRFIDDIFLVYGGTREQFDQYMAEINGIHPTIKFTSECSDEQVTFLDVAVHKGRLSKKLKCERQNRQCTTLTVSIDIDIWMKARRARHHLEQQLSQVTVVQTLLPPGWSKVGDLEFAKVVKDSDAILKLSRCVVIDHTMQWHVQVPQHLTSFADVKTPLDLYTATMFVVVMVMKGSWITFVKGWKDNELSSLQHAEATAAVEDRSHEFFIKGDVIRKGVAIFGE